MFHVVGYVHVGTCQVSPDHNFLAYTLDITGSEQFMLQIKDLQSGCILPDLKVDGVVSLAWAQDSCTLFYTTTDENQRPYRQSCFFFLSLSFSRWIFSYLFLSWQGAMQKTIFRYCE